MYYRYNCTSPISLNELEYIIDNNKKITLNKFVKLVNKTDFKNLVAALGYSKDFKINEDWHVTYHCGKFKNGEQFAYLQHSGIEYVFY